MVDNTKITDAILYNEDKTGKGIVANDPNDRGGKTQFGISSKFHPEAWADGKVTAEEAKTIFEQKYIKGPGFDKVPDERLRHLLADWSVHSGPALVVQKLQRILKVDADGVFGPQTLAAVLAAEPSRLRNKLAVERIRMIGRIIAKDKTQLGFLNNWLERASSFIE